MRQDHYRVPRPHRPAAPIPVPRALRSLDVEPNRGELLSVPITLRRERVLSFHRRWLTDFPDRRASTELGYLYQTTPFVIEHHDRWMDEVLHREAVQFVREVPVAQTYALHAMFRDACRDRVCFENPFEGIRKPTSLGRRGLTPPTLEEVHELADLAREVFPGWFGDMMRAFLLAGFYMLLRPGEGFALTQPAIDLDARVARVEWTLSAGRWIEPTKSGRPREVPLPSPVIDALGRLAPHPDHPYVFYTRRGRPLTDANLRRYWDPLRREWASRHPDRDPAIHLYLATRHAGISHLYNVALMPPEDLSVLAGHRDKGDLIVDLYGHPEVKRVRERTLEAWGDEPATSAAVRRGPGEVVRSYSAHPGWSSTIAAFASHDNDRLLHLARDEIRRRLGDPRLSIADVAGALGITTDEFQRVLRWGYSTFSRELRELRMTQAGLLVRRHPEVSLADVAKRCGYSFEHYFRTVFEDFYGAAPEAWRGDSRRLQARGTAPVATTGPRAGTVAERTRLATQALEIIRRDLAHARLEGVATELSASARHLQRCLAEQTGVGFETHLLHARIAHAKQMLSDDPWVTIAAVAAAVGYRQQHQFATAFRRVTGENPKHFRERCRAAARVTEAQALLSA